MKRPNLILGICVIAALAVGGLAAQSATAVTNGTTAFTCVKSVGEGPGTFKDAHCKEAAAGSGEYGHEAIVEPTEVAITNEATMLSTSAATPFRLQWVTKEEKLFRITATGVSGTATLTNGLTAGSEHYAHGVTPEGVTSGLIFTGLSASDAGCKIVGLPGGTGVIESKRLTASTEGQGMAVKFTPVGLLTFAEFEVVPVEAGKCTTWKGTYKIVGSIRSEPTGATVPFTYAGTESEKSLRLNSIVGLPVGIEAHLTIKARANTSQAYTPVGPTTVET